VPPVSDIVWLPSEGLEALSAPGLAVAIGVTVGSGSNARQVFTKQLATTTGGFAPMRFDGPLEVWTLEVGVQLFRRGGNGKMADLKFPPLPGEPWSLDWTQSSEGMPYEAEPARSPEKVRWGRKARLVFKATTPPTEDPADVMRRQMAKGVLTYGLPIGPGAK